MVNKEMVLTKSEGILLEEELGGLIRGYYALLTLKEGIKIGGLRIQTALDDYFEFGSKLYTKKNISFEIICVNEYYKKEIYLGKIVFFSGGIKIILIPDTGLKRGLCNKIIKISESFANTNDLNIEVNLVGNEGE